MWTAHSAAGCAGQQCGDHPDEEVSVFDVPLNVVRRTFEINTFGPLQMCQAFVR
jgi:NAD(P)-dependent dehydrogenase (short-subunit alcohol dehydrogenase family)